MEKRIVARDSSFLGEVLYRAFKKELCSGVKWLESRPTSPAG
jgi:hypothetical protein